MDSIDIWALAKEQQDFATTCRRAIHRFAEPSGSEVQTSALVCQHAEKLGLVPVGIAKTAQIIEMDTGRPGPHLVLRADMDALLMDEAPTNLKGPKAALSENPGHCHSCGHDAHTAMLLASMQVLHSLQDRFCGKVYFVFEEGEENGGSVSQILQYLKGCAIDGCWAIHVYSGLESGKISVDSGERMAGLAVVNMEIIGRGGHGSRPDLSINPVFAAASVLPNLAVAFANQLDVEKVVTLGISSIQAGQAHNIFPDVATIKGSLRFFDREVGTKALEVVKKVSRYTAKMNNCEVEFAPDMTVCGGPAINDAACAALASQVLAEVLPAGSVVRHPPWYATESFHEYLMAYPGVMAFLGIQNPSMGTGAQHHNAQFDVDDAALPTGIAATVAYALAFLNQNYG